MRRCSYCGKEHDDAQTVCVVDQQPTAHVAHVAQVPSVAPDTKLGPFLAEARRRRNIFFLWWLSWVPAGSAATLFSVWLLGEKGGYLGFLWLVVWFVAWHKIARRLKNLACPCCGKPAFAHPYFLLRHARCNTCGVRYAQQG